MPSILAPFNPYCGAKPTRQTSCFHIVTLEVYTPYLTSNMRRANASRENKIPTTSPCQRRN